MITVYTGRITERGQFAIDITVKSASTPEGRALAPTWELVMGSKSGAITPEQYTERYLALLRRRYAADKTPFTAILERPRAILCCYCAAGKFCHRHIVVDVLEKIAAAHCIPFQRGGEISPIHVYVR